MAGILRTVHIVHLLALLASQTVGKISENSSFEILKGKERLSSSTVSLPSSSAWWDRLLAHQERLGAEFDTVCSTDIMAFISAVVSPRPEMWAISMLDSFGKPPGGILLGAAQWPGSFSQCRSVVQENANGTPFRGQFCWAHLAVEKSVSQAILPSMKNDIIIKSGICLPDSCTAEDVLKMGKMLTELHPVTLLNDYITVKDIKCHQDFYLWEDTRDTAALMFLLFLIAVVATATFYDMYQRCVTQHGILPESLEKKHTFSKWLLAFSAYTNGKSLLKLDGGSLSIPSINGLRVISMLWIISGHTMLTYLPIMDNIKPVIAELNTFKYETFTQGVLAVDTFLFLSGFLLAYAYLNEYQRSRGKIPWFKFYFHRYWRLTPMYLIFVWIVYGALAKYLGNGPFLEIFAIQDSTCKKFGWANLLYTNNFMAEDAQCIGHAWFLAIDMQLYIFSPILLIPFTRSVRFSVFLAALIMTASATLSGYLTYVYDFSIGIDLVNTPPGSEKYNSFFELLYVKPYTRMNPYIVGLLTGMFIQKNKTITMTKVLVVVGWLMSTTFMLIVTYSVQYTDSFSILVKVLYSAFSRIIWSACLSWIVITCCSGYGGIACRILSFSIWNPLSRLTYCVFFWHIPVIVVMMSTTEVATPFSFFSLTNYNIAVIIITYSSAVILSLLFESPFARLESCILRKKINENLREKAK